MAEAGLDPTRLVPHSSRAGGQAQLELESDERRRQQGGWGTTAGMAACSRKALGHARAVAAALHDPTLCPMEQTRMMFGTHPMGHSAVQPLCGCMFGGASTGSDSPLKEAMDIYIMAPPLSEPLDVQLGR